MLSTCVLECASQADKYFFERDDYYKKEGALFEQPSMWAGKGAQKLGLSGEVARDQFKSLLQGKVPNGIQLGKMEKGEIKHRPGFDLTFSAPKSWSLAHYATQDKIFTKLLDKATDTVLAIIEQDCAMTKGMVNGEQKTLATGNLVIAKHYHRLSRDLDPQDHIHSIIMNMTERADGQWRSLASHSPNQPHHMNSEGFIERIRSRKLDYGAMWRMELAYLAIEAGFEIIRTGPTTWELAGVPQAMIDEFSQASRRIKDDMQLRGVKGAAQKEQSNFRTRPSSKKIALPEIKAANDARLSKFQFDFSTIMPGLIKKKALSRRLCGKLVRMLKMRLIMPSTIIRNMIFHYRNLSLPKQHCSITLPS